MLHAELPSTDIIRTSSPDIESPAPGAQLRGSSATAGSADELAHALSALPTHGQSSSFSALFVAPAPLICERSLELPVTRTMSSTGASMSMHINIGPSAPHIVLAPAGSSSALDDKPTRARRVRSRSSRQLLVAGSSTRADVLSSDFLTSEGDLNLAIQELKSSKHIDYFGALSNLPLEIIFLILGHLDGASLAKLSRSNSHYHNLIHSTPLLWRGVYINTIVDFPRHVYDALAEFEEQEVIEWALNPTSYVPREPVSVPRRITAHDEPTPSNLVAKLSVTEMKALAIETHFYLHQPCRCFVCLSIFDAHVPAVPEWRIRLCERCAVFNLIPSEQVLDAFLLQDVDLGHMHMWRTSVPAVANAEFVTPDQLLAGENTVACSFYLRKQALACAVARHASLAAFEARRAERDAAREAVETVRLARASELQTERERLVVQSLHELGLTNGMRDLRHPLIPPYVETALAEIVSTGRVSPAFSGIRAAAALVQTLGQIDEDMDNDEPGMESVRAVLCLVLRELSTSLPAYARYEELTEKLARISSYWIGEDVPADELLGIEEFNMYVREAVGDPNVVAGSVARTIHARRTMCEKYTVAVRQIRTDLENMGTFPTNNGSDHTDDFYQRAAVFFSSWVLDANADEIQNIDPNDIARRYVQHYVASSNHNQQSSLSLVVPLETRTARRTALEWRLRSQLPFVATSLLPLNSNTDEEIVSIMQSYVETHPVCHVHESTCLELALDTIYTRWKVVQNIGVLDAELSRVFERDITVDVLTSEHAKEEYNRIVGLPNTTDFVAAARYLYRIEILTQAITMHLPGWSLLTCSHGALKVYLDMIANVNGPVQRVFTDHPRTTIKLHTCLALGVPMTNEMETALGGIFDAETVRLDRVAKLSRYARKFKLLSTTFDPASIRRPRAPLRFDAEIEEIPNITFQDLACIWVYDPTIPNKTRLDIAFSHAKRLEESAARVEEVRRLVRNHRRYQALFEDAYQKHDFLKSVYMECAYRACPEYYAYTEVMAPLDVDVVVERLVDFVEKVRKRFIARSTCLVSFNYFGAQVE